MKRYNTLHRSRVIKTCSNESSASTHICIFPSRYNLAYSSGSSIAKAFKAHLEQGVVFKPSSAEEIFYREWADRVIDIEKQG